MKQKLLLSAFLCTTMLLQGFAQTGNKDRIPLKHGAHRIGKRTDADMQHWREYGLGQFLSPIHL